MKPIISCGQLKLNERKMKNILIADDQVIICLALRQVVLDCAANDYRCTEAVSRTALFEALKNEPPDVILLDTSSPEFREPALIQEIKTMIPGIPVIALALHFKPIEAIQSIKAGASGYLLLDNASIELAEALGKVTEGGKFLTAQLADYLACFHDKNFHRQEDQHLTEIEYEVLKLIGIGRSPKQIADALNIRLSVVRFYRHQIQNKLNLNTTKQLYEYAAERKDRGLETRD